MKEIRLKARAKINISLDVIRKREDGYHDLSMIMQTVNLYDKVNLKKTTHDGIVLKTNLSFLPVDERNLVYKVIAYMRNTYGIKEGIFADLFKVIPIAAGLAGGSADAAAAIKGMDSLFELHLTLEEMIDIGKKFGADIPYCLVEGTVLAQGIGDQMTLLKDFPECYIVIAKPNINVSTAVAFGGLKLGQVTEAERPNNGLLIEAIGRGDLLYIGQNMRNVLETVTAKEYPMIQSIKETLLEHGALGAMMSGSGSAVFGIFQQKEEAIQASTYLKRHDIVKFAYTTTIYNRRRD
ncbi:MAG: 4-(cytidine 5'-diphospho)-2-C-methyl-D-erythritol kinase [Vallitaleaceae bacterium]|nr:4-(cytidine 5'-diphospho)-2-C-methyl-D-erythritol kinase [Vallitaleaceae bacterium]